MADNFESTVRVIMERTGLGRDELMGRIREKQDKLIVTLEGAARMVGKELGVEGDG